MSAQPWHKRFHGDALTGMMPLTLEQRGAYNTVLDMLYDRGAPLIDNDRLLAGYMQCSPRKWRQLRDELIAAGKIYITRAGEISNVRFDSEIKKAAKISRKRAENGKLGGLISGEIRKNSNESNETDEAKSKQDRSLYQIPEPDREEGREGARVREALPDNLSDAVPADLNDMVSLAQECAAAAGTRQIDPGQIGKDITLCREWTEAGADPPLILATIREGVAASARPIFSLRFFDQPIRTAIAKQKALENGMLPHSNGPADLVTARAAERMRQRRAAGATGLVGLPGGAE
jgi:uncharacterized protein YdaU (DUF1376 family)